MPVFRIFIAVRIGFAVCLAAFSATNLAIAANAANTEVNSVTIQQGRLTGAVLPSGVMVFKGIPYAKPPIGDLRWRAPRPAASWVGTFTADHFGPACAQTGQGFNDEYATSSSEDCLYLNVWAPTSSLGKKSLPVFVWIHGGAFVAGAGSDPTFVADRLAARGIVVVTINYRLGVFGFLAHPELTNESPNRGAGNYAFMDQIAALEWVQQNISRFGGDPTRVTVAGQSAGSISVGTLLASALTKGLYARAIMESGAPGSFRVATLQQSEDLALRFAASVKSASLADLRALPTTTLLAGAIAFSKANPGPGFGPDVDGWISPVDPSVAFRMGKQNKVALLLGNNAREFGGNLAGASLVQAIQVAYGKEASRALAAYGLSDAHKTALPDPVLGSAGTQWAADRMFRCPTVITSDFQASVGVGVYEYQFEQPHPGHESLGAFHSAELPYVFGTLSPSGPLGAPFDEADWTFSDLIQSYWTNFAKNGDPNGPNLPHWPRYTTSEKEFVHLSEMGVVPDRGLRSEQCAIFANVLKGD